MPGVSARSEGSAMESVSIRQGALEARISLVGAELKSLRHVIHGEMMWQGDPAFWAKTSPLLFPVIGLVHGDCVTIDGRDHPMPQHGVAQSLRYDVEDRDGRSCRLSARDTEATRASYPFPFRLEVRYALAANGLGVEAIVANTGGRAMPANFGFHPGFRWPLEPGFAKADHVLAFDGDDILTMAPLIDKFLAAERTRVPLAAGILALDETMFENGALVAMAPNSRSVRFSARGGNLAIHLAFDGLRHLGIWMRPGGDYLCIEPWQGLPEPGDFAGDLRDRPDMDFIAPGCAQSYRMTILLSEKATA